MRARTAAPLDVGSSTSEATAVYRPEPATLPEGFIEQGELVEYASIGTSNSLAAVDTNMNTSASSKPDDEFGALLFQYQSSASGPTVTPEQTAIAVNANAYGEAPGRSSYYDYDSGQVVYGIDRYSSPAPRFGSGDRNSNYPYQGAQWPPIPGLSYFSGPASSQQHTHSTFNALNQYHMQLRMLMSPSPRPAEHFVPERYGQSNYPLQSPLQPAPHSLPKPPSAEYSGFAEPADNTADSTHHPINVRLVTDDGLLSDGELEPVSGDYSHVYSDGEIDAAEALATAGIGGIDLTSQQESAYHDVEGVVKARINEMLSMKNPKMLQGPSFRALMLLLKCIRLDDPDAIYAAIKSAPTQVISELNLLSAEFGLVMITEACVMTLLGTDAESLHANLQLGAAEAMTMTEIRAESSAAEQNPATDDTAQPGQDSWAHAPVPDSDVIEMETKQSSDGAESSSPDSDMDTSSDVDYEGQPSPPQQSALDNQTTALKASARPASSLSRETTPQFHARFSRSRAPSPPSAQSRTPRRLSYARQSPTPSDREARGFARIGSSMLSTHSGLNINNSQLFSGTDQGWRAISQPPTSRVTPEPAQPIVESTVCTSESGQLVVYLDHSDSSSDDSSSVTSECDDDDDDECMQSARDRASRLENRMINKECRRLAQEEDQLVGQCIDSSTRASASSSMAVASASRTTTPADSAKLSNEALLKAQDDIRTQEAAIARLKAEISRKQTKMLLRKKLHESKLKHGHGVAGSATAPATPYDGVESGFASPDPSAANSSALHDSLSSHSSSSCLLSREESGEVPTESPSDIESDVAMSAAVVTSLPECGPCEQMIQRAPPDIRSEHISNIMALLKGATQSKNLELRSVMRGTSKLTRAELEKFKLSVSHAGERLLTRQTHLMEQRRRINTHIMTLQAELGLVDMELDILSYSQAANRSYGAALEPVSSSSSNAASASTTNGSRAADLRNEIAAVHQFMDSMFRAADTSNEATASDNDLATQTSKMALVPSSLAPATTSAQPSAPPPRPQRDIVALRTKLVAMRQEQAAMSLKLTRLSEKRKEAEVSQSTLPAGKRQRVVPRASLGPIVTPPLSSSSSARHTPITQLLSLVRQLANEHTSKPSLEWSDLLCQSADNCIIQQLCIVDGVGMQDMTDFSRSLLSGMEPEEQTGAGLAPSLQGSVAISNSASLAYVPYQSPLSASAIVRVTGDSQSSEIGLSVQSRADEPADMSNITWAMLSKLLKLWPSTNPRVVTQYYANIEDALRKIKTERDGTAPNEVIAKAILPVISKYRLMISDFDSLSRSGLGQALKLDNDELLASKEKSPISYFSGAAESEVLQNDDIPLLKKAMSSSARFMPILNHDVARMSYSSLAAQIRLRQQHRPAVAPPLVRYYD
ncbi:hypothetical protein GGI21_002303, partial [Coemansia aciculifera]